MRMIWWNFSSPHKIYTNWLSDGRRRGERGVLGHQSVHLSRGRYDGCLEQYVINVSTKCLGRSNVAIVPPSYFLQAQRQRRMASPLYQHFSKKIIGIGHRNYAVCKTRIIAWPSGRLACLAFHQFAIECPLPSSLTKYAHVSGAYYAAYIYHYM